MKACIVGLIMFLLPFKTSFFQMEYKPFIEKKVALIADKANILRYLKDTLKLDSSKAKRLLAICINETGLKSNYWKLNNVCCIRYGKRAIGYKNYYGIYSRWEDCLKDLYEYEIKYGNRSWYNRFNKELTVIMKTI